MQTIAVTEIKGIEQTLLNESNALISSDVATDSTMLGKDNTISNSTSATNAFFTKQEYEEGMDWWKDREGALPALYEYQVSCRDFPSGHGPDTCIYYMTIIWTCYPPITEANWMDYQYMQVQHRLISGTTAFPWRYLGEGGPGNYNYGIVKVNGFQDPMDLNATHLPTRVQLRYRLLHKDFPGKADIPHLHGSRNLPLPSPPHSAAQDNPFHSPPHTHAQCKKSGCRLPHVSPRAYA